MVKKISFIDGPTAPASTAGDQGKATPTYALSQLTGTAAELYKMIFDLRKQWSEGLGLTPLKKPEMTQHILLALIQAVIDGEKVLRLKLEDPKLKPLSIDFAGFSSPEDFLEKMKEAMGEPDDKDDGEQQQQEGGDSHNQRDLALGDDAERTDALPGSGEGSEEREETELERLARENS